MCKNCMMVLILLAIVSAVALGARIELSDTRIVVLNPKSKIMTNAADMILDEIEKRTRITLQTGPEMSGNNQPAIVIGLGSEITKNFPLPPGPEMPSKADGYAVWIDTTRRGAATVCLAGVDERGALFAAGRLLRLLDMGRDTLSLNSDIKIATAPKIGLRGHQLGYRPKTNSYDAWTIDMWEQYYREMVVFGMNAIELIPPRSDDADDSPHFPKRKMEMMVLMSQLADDYGLDVWIWFPALDRDYTDKKTVDAAIEEWAEVFRKLPRVDAVFVPGGDPGRKHHPAILLAFIEKQKKNLNKYHPKAQIWMSPQDFHENEGFWPAFLDIIQKEQPAWLDGIVFGPSVWMSLSEPGKESPPKPKRRRTKIDIAMASLPALRNEIPAQYPIRRYPDITHSGGSQYEIPQRDSAWGRTLGREPINPRPVAYTKIFRDLQQYSIGFITYSEGCNDDFNKVLWSCLGWDIEMDPNDIAEEYARFFVSPRYAQKFAKGLFALEQNSLGPLLLNDQPYKTLRLFQEMEADATPQEKLSWRFQQGLYRAYYDAYIKARLRYETELKRRAVEVLDNAEAIGSVLAMDKAQAILDKGISQKTRPQWRQRTFELAEALYQSIRMQLSVEKYQAISIQRGANLDSIDKPFFNRKRLIEEFDKIRKMTSEDQRLEAIKQLFN
ncbi:MAG: hypothetical protein ACYTEQ_12460 [Planctomycetota bacterium]